MIISLSSPKGGSGKSTLAFNLATLFARDGFSTCIADCDDSKTSLRWFQIRNQIPEKLPSLDVFWTPNEVVVNLLRRLRREFSIVLVDSMPTYDNADIKILRLADYALIPTQCSGPDLYSLAMYMDRIQEVRAYKNTRLQTGIVVNHYDPRTNTDQLCHELLHRQSWNPFQEMIFQRTAYKETFFRGMGITEMRALYRKREYRVAADEMEVFYQALLTQLGLGKKTI